MPSRPRSSHQPTRWTQRLQLLVTACAIVFTIGTALQNWVFVDLTMMEHAVRLAGQSRAEAADNAPSFLSGFRIVGATYVIGNAVGLLARWNKGWVFLGRARGQPHPRSGLVYLDAAGGVPGTGGNSWCTRIA